MQFNLYITVKNPEGRAVFELERLVRQSVTHGAGLMDMLPEVDETVEIHEDSEVLIQLNRSE